MGFQQAEHDQGADPGQDGRRGKLPGGQTHQKHPRKDENAGQGLNAYRSSLLAQRFKLRRKASAERRVHVTEFKQVCAIAIGSPAPWVGIEVELLACW